MANEMDTPESRDPTGRADHGIASDTEKDKEHKQRKLLQQRSREERLPRLPREPAETTITDSRTPEKNVVAPAGVSADVHRQLNSSAAPQQHPSDNRSGRHREQLPLTEDDHPATGGSEPVPARHSTTPARASGNAAASSGRDTTSPYRAVYHREQDWQPTRPEGRTDSGGTPEQEGNTFSDTLESLRGFASRARDSVVRVAHGDFTDIRRAGESIQRVGTGDFSELAGIERYLAGVFDECASLGEKFCPCAVPETGQSYVGRAPAGPPPIMMLVDTPGGPYIRLIPDALVEESVRQGLLSAAEVEHQRQQAPCTAASS